ncbi:hypothetical protein LCM10_19865 [Rossellomorea aquimaris]|uniref:hypothetical protein n=1 Tax=Rossellomorea aquimaris TaxID=189382 RepID=UPI001CD81335|nr:hypothetical protein [Rossellomorea aquimaris]MCA1057205.1 hypothetical protein [Rossellomorea aquimaris]
MDELNRLRSMMKEETFKNHGFTEKMRKNILKEIHSDKGKSPIIKKPLLAPVLSSVFMLACLTVFIYFGGTQLGLFQGMNNAGQIDFTKMEWTDNDGDAKWSEQIELPTLVPFEVVDRTYKNTHMDEYDMVSIKLMGPEKQRLTIIMDVGIESGTPAMYEQVKIGDVTGSYRFNEEWKNSHLVWFKGGIMYYLDYTPGTSGIVLDKGDMKRIAESFQK